MPSDDRMAVLAPENVTIDYELAGIGSRFIACFFDTLAQGLLMIVGSVILAQIHDGPLLEPGEINPLKSAAAAYIIFFISVVWLGYYIFFETVWNGQTPGKRLVGLRVRKDGGYGIGFMDALIRNLVRTIDYLPYGYGVGALALLFSRRGKRLGDYAAGTVVVKERKAVAKPEPEAGGMVTQEIQRHVALGIGRFSAPEIDVIREFLRRRDNLPMERADAIARKLAVLVFERLGLQESVNWSQLLGLLGHIVREYDARAGNKWDSEPLPGR